MDDEVIVLSDDETVVLAGSPLRELPNIEIVSEVKHLLTTEKTQNPTDKNSDIDSILNQSFSSISDFGTLNSDSEKFSSENCNLPSTSSILRHDADVFQTSFSQPTPAVVSTVSLLHYESEKACSSRTLEIWDDAVVRKRRKKTKENVQEKFLKEELRQKRAEEKLQKKKEKNLAREISKFHRELSAAKKSKCEQNLFCFVSADLYSTFSGLEETLRQVFIDRKIGEQLVVENNSGIKVYWKRRTIEAEIRDGIFCRDDKLIYERFCTFFLPAEVFKSLCKTKGFTDFIKRSSEALPFASPRVVVVIHGIRPDFRVSKLILDAFEQSGAQMRFVDSVQEMACLIARMHRSIAKLENHIQEQNKPIFETEKGVKEGPELVKDWWSKMLKQVHRLSRDQHQAIIEEFPNPFLLSIKLQSMNECEAVRLIADIKTEEGRRVGPVIAKKLFLMMTSLDGSEVVDD